MIKENNYQLLVVDDHAIFANTLSSTIKQKLTGVNVVGTFYDAVSAIKSLRLNMPEIILMDIQMKGIDGFEATKKIKEKYPNIQILALSMFDDTITINRMFQFGASGYLSKNIDLNELKKAIKAVMRGEKYIESSLMSNYLNFTAKPNQDIDSMLSERQLTIIRYIKQGMTDKDIADMLHFDVKTIEKERAKIYKILNVKNAAEMVGKAFEIRLLP